MATNYTQVTGLLGINLEGNEQPSAGTDGTLTIPRIPVLTPVLISGNKAALYCISKTALNPGSTVALEASTGGAGTVAATTATADKSNVYVTLNIATSSTGDYIFARTGINLGI